jgi:hypothetical protein
MQNEECKMTEGEAEGGGGSGKVGAAAKYEG